MKMTNQQIAVLAAYIGEQDFKIGDNDYLEKEFTRYGFTVFFRAKRTADIEVDPGDYYVPPIGVVNSQTDTITELKVWFDDEEVELTKDQDCLLTCYIKGSLS